MWSGLRSTSALVFAKIGHIEDGLDIYSVLEYVKNIPMEVPESQKNREPKCDCRVWFKEAVERLDKAGFFVQCSNVDGLEIELNQRATAASYLKERSSDFRPVVYKSNFAWAWPDSRS